jgi:hypothetical protein
MCPDDLVDVDDGSALFSVASSASVFHDSITNIAARLL